MIERSRHHRQVEALLGRHPVVAILGARQVGKTTLAREIAARHAGPTTRFDLEDPDDLARLGEPRLALGGLSGLVVIDEVQRRPELFPVLRVLVDRPENPCRFLVLGSAAPELLRQSSETLAGRIVHHELDGFALDEVGTGAIDRLWLRGGFPRSFLADSDAASSEWCQAFVRTFLERDMPALGIQIPPAALHRFWRMMAHGHAQLWNAAELARAFGVAASTVRRYLDAFTGALVLWQLPPWHENIGKRQVKSPKVMIADTGLLHALLGIQSREDLDGHPKVGASWESFAAHQVAVRLGARRDECFFWATHGGAELDLLVVRGTRRRGFEFKRTTAPRTTHSMHVARESLGLDSIDVVHAGEGTFPLADGLRALSLQRIQEDLDLL